MLKLFRTMSTEKKLLKVFVYGTLKTSLPNHYWLKDTENGSADYLCDGKTITKYPLIIATKFNIPFLLNVPNTGHSINGEIYTIDKSMLLHLDKLEDYPKLYDREIIKIQGADGNIHDCWIYTVRQFPSEYLTKYTFLEEYNNPDEKPYCEEYHDCVIELINDEDEIKYLK